MTKREDGSKPTEEDLGAMASEFELVTNGVLTSRRTADRSTAEICMHVVRMREGKLHRAVGMTFDEWASETLDLSPAMVKVLLRVGQAFTREQIEQYGVTKLNAALTYKAAKEKLGERVDDVTKERITVKGRDGNEKTILLLDASSRQIASATREVRKRFALEESERKPGKKKAEQLAACMNAAAETAHLPTVRVKTDWTEKTDAYFLAITGVDTDKVPITLRALANAVEDFANEAKRSRGATVTT